MLMRSCRRWTAGFLACTLLACDGGVVGGCQPTKFVPASATVKQTAGSMTLGAGKPKSVTVEYKRPDDESLGAIVFILGSDQPSVTLVCWLAPLVTHQPLAASCSVAPYPDAKQKANAVTLAGEVTALQASGTLLAADDPQPGDTGDMEVRLDLSGQTGNGLMSFALSGVLVRVHVTWGPQLCYGPGE